jgi:hypothetical protein
MSKNGIVGSLFETDKRGAVVTTTKRKGYKRTDPLTIEEFVELSTSNTTVADEGLGEMYVAYHLNKWPGCANDLLDIITPHNEPNTHQLAMQVAAGIDPIMSRNKLLKIIGEHYREVVEQLIQDARELEKQAA